VLSHERKNARMSKITNDRSQVYGSCHQLPFASIVIVIVSIAQVTDVTSRHGQDQTGCNSNALSILTEVFLVFNNSSAVSISDRRRGNCSFDVRAPVTLDCSSTAAMSDLTMRSHVRYTDCVSMVW